MKKNLFFISLFFVIASQLYAQDAAKAQVRGNSVSKKYMRPSVTVLYVNRGGSRAERMKNIVVNYPVSGKFNDNNTSTRSFSGNPDSNGFIPSTQAVLSQEISRQIVAKWFNRNSNGEFNMDIISERGMYNATDAEVMKASASQRKLDMLKDAGELLLDRSYILVYDVKNIRTPDEEMRAYNSSSDQEGYKANFDCYVFKLEWNDSIASIFYNNLWVDASSPNAEKVAQFEKATFPVKFVTRATSVFGSVNATQYKDHSKILFGRPLNDDELFASLFPQIVDIAEVSIAKSVEDFQVKTPIAQTNPIRAKIGLKEGLSVDKRFFVYEYEMNSKGEKVAKRKGVIRATNDIADNRKMADGKSETSRFYRTSGLHTLYEGMLLQEKPDWGLGLTLGWGSTAGSVGDGLTAMLELNASMWAAKAANALPPGIKVYGAYSIGLTELAVKHPTNSNYDGTYNMSSWVAGISKDLNFISNIVVIPFVGYGNEVASNNKLNKEEEIYTTPFIQFGARLGVNITHNVQLLGSYSYNSLTTTAYTVKDATTAEFTESQLEKFNKNRGATQLTFGLRAQF